MTTEQATEFKKWKKQFPIWKRILYWLVGYPPYSSNISDEQWKRWESRF